MQDMFLYLFIAACAGLLLWGMGRPERVYQYPFLIGAIFSAFLIPQAISLVNNPGIVSEGAINRTLFVGALCMFMAWAGYAAKPLRSISEGPIRVLNKRKLNFAALAISAISLAAFYEILRMPQQEIGPSGPFTILVFFSSFCIVTIPVFLAQLLERVTWKTVFLNLVSGGPLYLPMFTSGRRGAAAAFFLIIGLMLYFRKSSSSREDSGTRNRCYRGFFDTRVRRSPRGFLVVNFPRRF